jgi:hypothetical protein
MSSVVEDGARCHADGFIQASNKREESVTSKSQLPVDVLRPAMVECSCRFDLDATRSARRCGFAAAGKRVRIVAPAPHRRYGRRTTSAR